MPGSTLYRNEKVFEIKDCEEMMAQAGKDKVLIVGGERRLLSRLPPPEGHDSSGYSASFASAGFPLIDRANWDAAIDEQIARKARVSDHVDFPAFDQDGLPTCWAICTAQCYSIKRRCVGLPHRQMSGCSLAVPISGGHSGGFEGDSLEYAVKHGVASADAWPENNTNRSLNSDAAVIADREFHKVLLWLEMKTDDEWATALLRTLPGVFAYDWMSHCMTMADFVRIEAGRYGYRVRNSWRDDWGSKNDLGMGGFAVYPMGHGTPDSGDVLSEITSAEK